LVNKGVGKVADDKAGVGESVLEESIELVGKWLKLLDFESDNFHMFVPYNHDLRSNLIAIIGRK
jgi:hypothetical protein